jgi:hypothetical protein
MRSPVDAFRARAASIIPFVAVAAMAVLAQPTGIRASSSGSAESGGQALYVAPNGHPTNPGTKEQPLDLATALSKSSPARPGDTIWLRDGIYAGHFESFLQGTAAQPIIVRAYPGERPRLDGGRGAADRDVQTLRLRGAHVWYWGLEIFSSWPDKQADSRAFSPQARGIDLGGTNRIIHCIIHDVSMGSFTGSSSGTEIYGNLSYYNGYYDTSSNRGRHHDWYPQNKLSTPRLVEENIVLSGFGHGIHAFSNNNDSAHRFHLIGNIAVNKGEMGGGMERNLLLGVAVREPIYDVVVRENLTYYRGTQGQNNIGHNGGYRNAEVRDNYWIGGNRSLQLDRGDSDPNPKNIALTGNVFYRATSPSNLSSLHPKNTYYGNTRPTGIWRFVRPVGRYEPGRAHIAIYNWDLAPTVIVDLSRAGLASGQGYVIKDAYHFYAPPVASGTFDSAKPTVSIPMTGLTLATPIGNNIPDMPIHPAPEFGVFIVLPVSGQAGPTADAPAAPTRVRVIR